MGIKLNVTDEDKRRMANFATEFQVLSALIRERKFLMDEKAVDILIANGLDPKLYAMNFLPSKDRWDAVLKPGAISIPAPGTDLSKITTN